MPILTHDLLNGVDFCLQLITKTLKLKIPSRIGSARRTLWRRDDRFEIFEQRVRDNCMRDAGLFQQLDIFLDRLFCEAAVLAANHIGKAQIAVQWSQIIRHRTIISNPSTLYKFELNGEDYEASV